MNWVLSKIKDKGKQSCLRKYLTKVFGLIKISLTLGDIISDIYYTTTTEFYNKTLFFFSIMNLFIVPFNCSYQYLFKLFKSTYTKKKKLILFIFIAILLPILFYPLTIGIFFYRFFSPKYENFIFHLMLKEAIFESIPQLFIQGLNNYYKNSWTTTAIISFSFGSLSLSLGMIRIINNSIEKGIRYILKRKKSEVIKKVTLKFSEYRVLHENPQEHIEDEVHYLQSLEKVIIKLFYEIFDKDKILKENTLKIVPSVENNISEEYYKFLESCVSEEYITYLNTTKINKNEFLSRCYSLLGFFVLIKITLVIAIWIFSIIYVVIAEFSNDFLRIFSLVLITYSLYFNLARKLNNEDFPTKFYVLFKFLANTDLSSLSFLLYGTSPPSKIPELVNGIHLLYSWFFIFTSQIYNYFNTKSNGDLHIIGIVLSSIYLFMPFLSLILFLTKDYLKIQYF